MTKTDIVNKLTALRLWGDVRALIRERTEVLDATKTKRRCKGGGSASKAKGRDGCHMARDLILDAFPGLLPDDVVVKATSQGGVDLHLSPQAVARFPFGIEVKRSESLNIWAALKQAEINAQKKNLPAVVFFSRAHGGHYVALDAAVFVKALAKIVLMGAQ